MFSETAESPNIVINFVKNNKNESMEYGKSMLLLIQNRKFLVIF